MSFAKFSLLFRTLHIYIHCSCFTDPVLIIRSNQNLKNIVLTPFLNGKRVVVRGNAKLDKSTIEMLKKNSSPDSEIQDVGGKQLLHKLPSF